MRRLKKSEAPQLYLAIKSTNERRRSLSNLAASDSVCCIACWDNPCITAESLDLKSISGVSLCPIDAIVLGANGVPQVNDGCIGCGLCALSCPVGAIHNRLGRANVTEIDERIIKEISDKAEFERLRDQVLGPVVAEPDHLRAKARELASSTRLLKQAAFYPLIAGLFRLLGEKVFKPPTGDTSNRIDLILPDYQETIAIEVKSATETVSINVKSITQALENKVVLRQRKFFPTSSETSSLVVGFEYPADRSEVQSIINDFWNAFGIRIGIVTVEDLFVEVLTCSVQKSRFERERLTRLIGEFR